MISEKKLKEWRKDALIFNSITSTIVNSRDFEQIKQANIKIIKITQELLDQMLINKKSPVDLYSVIAKLTGTSRQKVKEQIQKLNYSDRKTL